jgi:hypothetical protein
MPLDRCAQATEGLITKTAADRQNTPTRKARVIHFPLLIVCTDALDDDDGILLLRKTARVLPLECA